MTDKSTKPTLPRETLVAIGRTLEQVFPPQPELPGTMRLQMLRLQAMEGLDRR